MKADQKYFTSPGLWNLYMGPLLLAVSPFLLWFVLDILRNL